MAANGGGGLLVVVVVARVWQVVLSLLWCGSSWGPIYLAKGGEALVDGPV